jgi:magnesium transporter
MDTDQILLKQFIVNYPEQAAISLDSQTNEEIAIFFTDISPDLAISAIKQMNNYKVAKSFENIELEKAVLIFEKLDIQQAELVLRQCEDSFREKLLGRISPEISQVLGKKLKYASDTVGSIMNLAVPSIRKELNVAEAISILKQEENKISTVICVIDPDGILEGLINTVDLLLADSNTEIAAIMKTDVPRFSPQLAVQALTNHPGWSEFLSIPVVEDPGRVVGVLDFETIYNTIINSSKDNYRQLSETGNTLGELYRIGMTAFLNGLSK